ncbi:MoaD family protein [Candidatus Bathyarchaeota archaeon]|nr:MoaD family protein [Candidatus Bathyarchaeota archaeon]
MIRIDVNYFSNVRALTGESGSTLELPERSSVRDLLIIVAARYGDELREYLFTDEGGLHSHVVVILNGRGVGVLEGLDTALDDGDRVAILPSIGGG